MRAVKNIISGILNFTIIIAMSLTGWQVAMAKEAD